MKLVTPAKEWLKTQPIYIPGKCNIGSRGRAVRLVSGVSLIALSLVVRFTLLSAVNMLFSLTLILPLYIGFLSILEGSMSFCVLHASKGTYDFSEPKGMPTTKSRTRQVVGSEEWKNLDRRKARLMHLEAVTGAVILTVLLVFA